MTNEISLGKQTYSQYHIVVTIKDELCIVLIDTGSCISYVSEDIIDLADAIFYLEKEVVFETVSDSMVKLDRQVSILVKFKRDLDIVLEIPIDSTPNRDKRTIL